MKDIKSLLLLGLILLSIKSSWSQACLNSQAPLLPQERQDQLSFRNEEVFTIPIVVHQVLPSNTPFITQAQVALQVEALNRDFRKRNQNWRELPFSLQVVAADAKIEFCLAGITQTTTSFSNIGISESIFSTEDGGADAWATDQYLNVWVCELPENLLGLSSYPEDAGKPNDGVVINFNYFGLTNSTRPGHFGRTLVHEVGHYFGLPHPWGEHQNECEEDDGIADTPFQDGPNYRCFPTTEQECTENTAFGNFMDYSPDCCLAMFTQDQIWIMRNNLLLYRNSFSNPTNHCQPKTQNLSFNIFPNPAHEICVITWPSNLKTVQIQVFDSGGRLLSMISQIARENQIELCLNEWPKGMLFFKFITNEGNSTTQSIIHY